MSSHIDGLVQERCNSIAKALASCLSCTNTSTGKLASLYRSLPGFSCIYAAGSNCCMNERLHHTGYGRGNAERILIRSHIHVQLSTMGFLQVAFQAVINSMLPVITRLDFSCPHILQTWFSNAFSLIKSLNLSIEISLNFLGVQLSIIQAMVQACDKPYLDNVDEDVWCSMA